MERPLHDLPTVRSLLAAARALAIACGIASAPATGSIAADGSRTAMATPPVGAAACRGTAGERPVYLTFDTGHMGVAPLVAEVLARHGVRASFFLANERTLTGGASLDEQWAPWWRARAEEGHVFGSHTWDHDVWQADLPPDAQGRPRFRVRPTQGPNAGRARVLDGPALCHELQRPAERWKAWTGQPMAPLWRAPGGRTSPALLEAARSCGFHHVPWTPAGFLGDELDSSRHPNARLLAQSLERIRANDILLAHLGIWSRQDPWAPAVLEPLITGLQDRGLCFATLRDHPQFRPLFEVRR